DDAGAISVALEPQRPVVDGNLGGGLRESCETKACTRHALVGPQSPQPRIGDGGVGEQELARCEGARVVFLHFGPIAEEGDLHAVIAPARILQPTGDVPPLGSIIGMGTVIAWK